MSKSARLALALSAPFALALAHCGGSTQSSSNTNTGGSGAAGGSAGSSGATAGAGGSGGGIEDASFCSTFGDDTPASTVHVIFSNQRSTPIFVHSETSFDTGARFTIVDSNGTPIELFPLCGYASCEILQKGPSACDAGIAFSPVIRIDPGGTYEETWNGLFAIERAMPAACYPDSGPSLSSCLQMKTPSPASYGAHALAGTSCSNCICVPSSSGSCANPGGMGGPAVSGDALSASATLVLPGTTQIDLVFAGAADGGA